MKSFWHFLGLLILLIVAGSLLYKLVYALRTGRDLQADRAGAAAKLLSAVQPGPAVGSASDLAQPDLAGAASSGTYQSVLAAL